RHHRAGGGGRLLDAHRPLTARERTGLQSVRRRRPVGPPFSYYALRSFFFTTVKTKSEQYSRCRAGAADHIAAANAAVSFSPALWPRGRMRGRSFPGEMCDETDLCCVCGIAGTAGFVSIRDRGAEDSQAMQ